MQEIIALLFVSRMYLLPIFSIMLKTVLSSLSNYNLNAKQFVFLRKQTVIDLAILHYIRHCNPLTLKKNCIVNRAIGLVIREHTG